MTLNRLSTHWPVSASGGCWDPHVTRLVGRSVPLTWGFLGGSEFLDGSVSKDEGAFPGGDHCGPVRPRAGMGSQTPSLIPAPLSQGRTCQGCVNKKGGCGPAQSRCHAWGGGRGEPGLREVVHSMEAGVQTSWEWTPKFVGKRMASPVAEFPWLLPESATHWGSNNHLPLSSGGQRSKSSVGGAHSLGKHQGPVPPAGPLAASGCGEQALLPGLVAASFHLLPLPSHYHLLRASSSASSYKDTCPWI